LNTPGISNIGGLNVTAPNFNENMPLWDDNAFMPDENDDPLTVNLTDGTTNFVIQSPVTNTVTGAMAIQQHFENQEWVYQSGSAVAYAPHLQKDPLSGVPAKSVIIQFAKGDQSIENPTTAAFLRAGALADVATYYRHDLVFANNPSLPQTLWNPHTFMGAITNAIMKPIALAAQQQIAAFFASDGSLIIQPTGVPAEYCEVGMDQSELPEGLNFIVAAPAPAPIGAAVADRGSLTDTNRMLTKDYAFSGLGGRSRVSSNSLGDGLYKLRQVELLDTVIVANLARGGAPNVGENAGRRIGQGNDVDQRASVSIDALAVVFDNLTDEFDDSLRRAAVIS
jgi:hypothetical protein